MNRNGTILETYSIMLTYISALSLIDIKRNTYYIGLGGIQKLHIADVWGTVLSLTKRRAILTRNSFC